MTGGDGIQGASTPQKLGTEIERLGPYLLLEHLGAGGMGEGYLAVRQYAGARQKFFLKRILPQHRTDPDFIRWFAREAAIVASLRHAQIVGLIEVDLDGGYLVFELIDGCDLKKLLASQPATRLSVDLAVFIATKILEALAYAHTHTHEGERAGVVHRDLSPSNVLISYAGEVKVGDFGVASVLKTDARSMTRVMGKAGYQAPEETDGEAVDQRSDLFSLGVMLYEMLAGRRPYTGKLTQVVKAIADGRREPLQRLAPDVSTELSAIVDKLLSPDPAERFASAAEAQFALATAHSANSLLYVELGRLVEQVKPRQPVEIPLSNALAAATPPTAARSAHTDSATARARLSTDEVPTLIRPRAGASSVDEPPTIDATPLVEDAITTARRKRRNIRLYGSLGLGMTATAFIASTLGAPKSTSNAPSNTPATETTTLPATSTPPVATAQIEPPLTGTSITAEETKVHLSPEPAQPLPAEPIAPVAPGILRVGAFPSAQVWLDGVYVGWTYLSLPVAPGQHKVSIGLNDRERSDTIRTVTVKSAKTTKVRF